MSQGYQLRPDRDLTILIPARAGSKRVPGKNVKPLGGKPLLQWSVDSALAAHPYEVIVSTDLIVSTRSVGYPVVGSVSSGAKLTAHLRKPEHATDTSPDIDWVLDVLPMVTTPFVAICRPTSPFRTASTIRRGFAQLVADPLAHSIRAVTRVTHPHPAKMWWLQQSKYLLPVLDGHDMKKTPWHSLPTQCLPAVWRQTASLEIARTHVIRKTKTISGTKILPFFCEALEAFDINTPEDWADAERIAASLAPA